MPKSKKRSQKSSHKPENAPSKIDAISVRRTAKGSLIPIEKVHKPDWMVGEDTIFISLYKKYLTGRLSGYATRVPIEQIQEGFYSMSQNLEYFCDSPPDHVVEEQMLNVRKGARHPLHLYSNPKPNSEIRFLCPDDVALCLAYRRLSIKSVPAIVFAPGMQSLPESSLEIKVTPSAKNLGPRVCGLISTEKPQTLPSILGSNFSVNATNELSELTDTLRSLVVRLRLFHVSEPGQLHYHHMVFSAVVRVQETLRAIELLIKADLWYQALALLRVLYEIHLNFFFDWLQPETNYRFLAASAVLSSTGLAKARLDMSKELISQGASQKSADEQANIAWRPVTFASTVSKKARLPKVGILYHQDIYSFLSQITHQDFEVASLHANRFDDEAYLTIDGELKITYLRFLDSIISEFAVCVDRDIGHAQTYNANKE
jgi:Family of unknown function (DUF5677)